MTVERKLIAHAEVETLAVADFDELGNKQALCDRMINLFEVARCLLDLIRGSRDGDCAGLVVGVDVGGINAERREFFFGFGFVDVVDLDDLALLHELVSRDDQVIVVIHPVEVICSRKVVKNLVAGDAMEGYIDLALDVAVDDDAFMGNLGNRVERLRQRSSSPVEVVLAVGDGAVGTCRDARQAALVVRDNGDARRRLWRRCRREGSRGLRRWCRCRRCRCFSICRLGIGSGFNSLQVGFIFCISLGLRMRKES